MATIGDIGAASAEWLAFADRTRLPPLPHENTDLRNLRRAANEARSRDSRSEMEELGNMEIWTLQLDDKILSFDLGIVDMKMVCIATKDQTEIPGKLFSPPLVPSDGGKLPVVLYFHGGGFLSGSSFTEDATCSRLALNCHVLVVSIIYRHTPEWTAPTQMNDAWGARNWVSSNIQNYNGDINRVVVAGISSGGCLAAGIALKEAKAGLSMIKGQALWTPWLCQSDVFPWNEFSTPEQASRKQCADAPLLPTSLLNKFADALCIDPTDEEHMEMSPLVFDCELIKCLPRAHILANGNDPLRDDALLYERKLKDMGVETKLHIFNGLPHGFDRFGGLLESTALWRSQLQSGICWLLSKNASNTG